MLRESRWERPASLNTPCAETVLNRSSTSRTGRGSASARAAANARASVVDAVSSPRRLRGSPTRISKASYSAARAAIRRIGDATLTALDAYLVRRGRDGEAVLVKAIEALRGERYITLAERRPANEAFLYGWLAHRVGVRA